MPGRHLERAVENRILDGGLGHGLARILSHRRRTGGRLEDAQSRTHQTGKAELKFGPTAAVGFSTAGGFRAWWRQMPVNGPGVYLPDD